MGTYRFPRPRPLTGAQPVPSYRNPYLNPDGTLPVRRPANTGRPVLHDGPMVKRLVVLSERRWNELDREARSRGIGRQELIRELLGDKLTPPERWIGDADEREWRKAQAERLRADRAERYRKTLLDT